MIVTLAGTTFGNCQSTIRKYGSNEFLYFTLVREPDNPYDPNAIKVMLGDNGLGYIPRGVASSISPLMDNGQKLVAEFIQINESPNYDTIGMTVKIIEM